MIAVFWAVVVAVALAAIVAQHVVPEKKEKQK